MEGRGLAGDRVGGNAVTVREPPWSPMLCVVTANPEIQMIEMKL